MGTSSNASRSFQTNNDAHPELAMVFADDEEGLSGLGEIRFARDKNKRFVMAGFGTEGTGKMLVQFNQVTLIVDQRLNTAGKKGLQVLLDKMEGKDVGDRVEIPAAILRQTAEEAAREPASLRPVPAQEAFVPSSPPDEKAAPKPVAKP